MGRAEWNLAASENDRKNAGTRLIMKGNDLKILRLPAFFVAILTGEFRLVKATFFQWRIRPPPDGITTFSYHRRGMNQVVLWCLVPLAAIEVAAVHLLIRHWSQRWAWVATDIGILGALYLVGSPKACVSTQ